MGYANAMIVSQDANTRESLGALLAKLDMAVIPAASMAQAELLLKCVTPSVIISAEDLPHEGLATILRLSKAGQRPVPVIVFSALADWKGYLKIISAGAFDYVRFPPGAGEMERVVRNALHAGRFRGAAQAASAG